MKNKKTVCPHCEIEMILIVEEEQEKEPVKKEDKDKSKYKCQECGYECMMENLML